MSQQEFNQQEALDSVKKIGEGALEMIGSLEKIITSSYSNLGEAGAKQLAEAMKASKFDSRVVEFEKQIKDLSKAFK